MEEKENKTPKTKQKKIPTLREERNKQNSGPRSRQIRKTPCSRHPGEGNTSQGLVALLTGTAASLQTPTHWPLVSYLFIYFFSFLLFNTQTLNFQSLKKFT